MIDALSVEQVPFLVGGAYAFAHFTGIERHTKDLDVFVRRADVDRALAALARAGCDTELTFPHWLGKAFCGGDFIDVIFSSGNGLAEVDDGWFAHAVDAPILDRPLRLTPPEEMLWSKSFVMERERYDGADVNHLLRAASRTLDWPRLLRRFGEHWPVLLSHLLLFRYVYPPESSAIPEWVMADLLARAARNPAGPDEEPFRGPFLSREQYLIDVEQWGYPDPRLRVNGGEMSRREVATWTAGIDAPG